MPGLLAGYAVGDRGCNYRGRPFGERDWPGDHSFERDGALGGNAGHGDLCLYCYGSASLRRDFGLEIRAPDVLWGFAAVAAALIVSEIVVVVFAGTKFAGSNDQIISQQKGHEVGLVILTLIVELGAPFFEELFFRGFLRTALQERFGAGGAVWLQAAFFGFATSGIENRGW